MGKTLCPGCHKMSVLKCPCGHDRSGTDGRRRPNKMIKLEHTHPDVKVEPETAVKSEPDPVSSADKAKILLSSDSEPDPPLPTLAARPPAIVPIAKSKPALKENSGHDWEAKYCEYLRWAELTIREEKDKTVAAEVKADMAYKVADALKVQNKALKDQKLEDIKVWSRKLGVEEGQVKQLEAQVARVHRLEAERINKGQQRWGTNLGGAVLSRRRPQ